MEFLPTSPLAAIRRRIRSLRGSVADRAAIASTAKLEQIGGGVCESSDCVSWAGSGGVKGSGTRRVQSASAGLRMREFGRG